MAGTELSLDDGDPRTGVRSWPEALPVFFRDRPFNDVVGQDDGALEFEPCMFGMSSARRPWLRNGRPRFNFKITTRSPLACTWSRIAKQRALESDALMVSI